MDEKQIEKKYEIRDENKFLWTAEGNINYSTNENEKKVYRELSRLLNCKEEDLLFFSTINLLNKEDYEAFTKEYILNDEIQYIFYINIDFEDSIEYVENYQENFRFFIFYPRNENEQYFAITRNIWEKYCITN